MNFLFDVSPEEVPDDAKQKSKRHLPKSAGDHGESVDRGGDGADPEQKAVVFSTHRRRNDTIIGRSEGHYKCADTACGSTYFDILDEWRGEWFIECMVCGTGQYAPAVSGVIQTPDEAGTFVFADGRYEGFSMADVANDPNGPKYIAWAAESHKREAVRTACKKWIDSIQATA